MDNQAMDGDDGSPSIRYRRNSLRRSKSSSMSKYGAHFEPPTDDAIFYPHDEDYKFFASGRDFESVYVNHRYTEKEKETLATYESLDYLPSHSVSYKTWLKKQPRRLDWDRWLMMGFIGFSVGMIGFLLHQFIDLIADFKWEHAGKFIERSESVFAWLFVTGYSFACIFLSAGIVVFFRPSAGGSGLPELIGFLNGTVVRHIFNIKTLVAKFFSCVFSVAGGMPVGPEGPMIHMGGMVGAGLSQFKSDTLRFKLPFFERFRNSEDRRNFISAGAGAGVSSAFGAPVGGLLFSMEEVSSFWNMKLSWQIFFCCMVSTFTTDLFNSAFDGFKYKGNFLLFRAENYILFQVTRGIALNALGLVPAAILGVLGGLFGSLFVFINLKLARTRRRILSRMTSSYLQKAVKFIEPLIVIILMCTASVFIPAAFSCTKLSCTLNATSSSPKCLTDSINPLHAERTVEKYTCEINRGPNTTFVNQTYNEVATLLFTTGEGAIKHLFSRNTHLEFGYPTLVSVLIFYFLMACWASGTSISCGLVVPMLFIGGLYGRLIGRVMVDIAGGVPAELGSYWSWIDPGAFALIGAASFFGGVSRLTMSLTVIMMEITNDIQFLLLIMVAIMVAKWVGDFFTHPLYHALLELKCIPFLDSEPVVVHADHKETLNLELFSAHDVMSSPPKTLNCKESVSRLAELLLDTPHGGFPVLRSHPNGEKTFFGFIHRLEITLILKKNENFISSEDADEYDVQGESRIDYEELTLDKLQNPAAIQEMLHRYCEEDMYKNLRVDLAPYVNQSSVSIPEKFSLHRTYIIFRTLGLRHLTVVDNHNRVVGIITRKDLMGFGLEEKLTALISNKGDDRNASVVEMTDHIS